MCTLAKAFQITEADKCKLWYTHCKQASKSEEMTKKQIKKEGYRRIVKCGETHQRVFDSLKAGKTEFDLTLAEELAKIPSDVAYRSKQTFRVVLLSGLGLISILRLLFILTLVQLSNLNPVLIIPLLLFGLLVPGIAIFALLKRKTDRLRSASILLALGVIRGFRNFDFSDIYALVVTTIIVTVIIMGIILPEILKTPYEKKLSTIMVDGMQKTETDIVFNSGIFESGKAEILDMDT